MDEGLKNEISKIKQRRKSRRGVKIYFRAENKTKKEKGKTGLPRAGEEGKSAENSGQGWKGFCAAHGDIMFEIEESPETPLNADIRVVGVGGGGGNAVEAMIKAGVRGVKFITVNTDAQASVRRRCGNKNPIRGQTHPRVLAPEPIRKSAEGPPLNPMKRLSPI